MSRDYSKIPEHCRDGLRLYVERGIPPGSFVTAVLENNLVEAFGRADHVNMGRIRDYADWLYNDAPSSSWGSPARVKAWIERGGEGTS